MFGYNQDGKEPCIVFVLYAKLCIGNFQTPADAEHSGLHGYGGGLDETRSIHNMYSAFEIAQNRAIEETVFGKHIPWYYSIR
jgi:hypothetical protein